MAYKVLVKLNDTEDWIPVIDMKLSRTKKVDRLFIDEEAAQFYIDQQAKGDERTYSRQFKIEEAPELDDDDLVAPI